MKFAKIAATLIGVANASTMGGLSIHGASSGGHSAKTVTTKETVHCGQYPHFVQKYRIEYGTTYNGQGPKGNSHEAVAHNFGSTAYIPADEYVNDKWCVTLDLKFRMHSEYAVNHFEHLNNPSKYGTVIKFFEDYNTGHVGIVNYNTVPKMEADITYRQFPMFFPVTNTMRNAQNTQSLRLEGRLGMPALVRDAATKTAQWLKLPEMPALDHHLKSSPVDEGAYRVWHNVQFIINRSTGKIQYAQDGVVFFEQQNDDYKTGQNWVQMMLTNEQDHATIRRPDFEKMYKESFGRIDKKNIHIKKQTDKIIKLRNELTKGHSDHKSCTTTVKSTLVEVDTTTHKVQHCNNNLINLGQKITAFTHKSDTCKALLTKMTGEVTLWNTKYTHCTQKDAHLSFVIKSRIEELERLKKRVAGNTANRNALNKEIAHRDDKIKNLSIQINHLQAIITTSTSTYSDSSSANTQLTLYKENAKKRIALYEQSVLEISAMDADLLEKYYYTLNTTISLDQTNLELRIQNLALNNMYDAVLTSDNEQKHKYETLLLKNGELEIHISELQHPYHTSNSSSSSSHTTTSGGSSSSSHSSSSHTTTSGGSTSSSTKTVTTTTTHTEISSDLQDDDEASSIGAVGTSVIAVSVVSLGAGAFMIFKKFFNNQNKSGLTQGLIDEEN